MPTPFCYAVTIVRRKDGKLEVRTGATLFKNKTQAFRFKSLRRDWMDAREAEEKYTVLACYKAKRRKR